MKPLALLLCVLTLAGCHKKAVLRITGEVVEVTVNGSNVQIKFKDGHVINGKRPVEIGGSYIVIKE